MHIEQLSAPVVMLAPSGQDSLLVYTYENLLYHYIISVTNASVKLVQVGQIALHGIIRSPPRVRAMSWILPEDQLGKKPQRRPLWHSSAKSNRIRRPISGCD